MKKIILTENERSRILNLHSKQTKKDIISEVELKDIQDLLVNKFGFKLTGQNNGIDNKWGQSTKDAIMSALTQNSQSNIVNNNQQNQGYIEGMVITPEFEKEKVSEGMKQESLDNFKKIPNYYRGSIGKFEFDKGEQWSWFPENNSEEIYYLDDGRKLKGTYDQQNDKYNWADSGKWM
jgi:hypothetical protein